MNHFDLSIVIAKILLALLNFLAYIFDYIYVSIKVFRILCFAKITFDQLPLYNPYKWPLSFIRIVTRPYLRFWSKFLPNLKIGHMTYEISTIIALEFLANLLKVSFYLRICLFSLIENLSAFIQ